MIQLRDMKDDIASKPVDWAIFSDTQSGVGHEDSRAVLCTDTSNESPKRTNEEQEPVLQNASAPPYTPCTTMFVLYWFVVIPYPMPSSILTAFL